MVGQNEQEEEEAEKGLHLTCRLATWQLDKTQLGATNCLLKLKLKLKPLSLYPCIEGDLVHKNGNVEGLSLFPDGVAMNANLQL